MIEWHLEITKMTLFELIDLHKRAAECIRWRIDNELPAGSVVIMGLKPQLVWGIVIQAINENPAHVTVHLEDRSEERKPLSTVTRVTETRLWPEWIEERVTQLRRGGSEAGKP